MNHKTVRIVYLISTGLMSALMVFSASMYFLNHEMVKEMFTSLGYPTYIIYPLAVAKLLGLVAIWTKKSNTLKEWAYAGFFFDFILASSAHIVVQDGGAAPALGAIVMLLTSYIMQKRMTA